MFDLLLDIAGKGWGPMFLFIFGRFLLTSCGERKWCKMSPMEAHTFKKHICSRMGKGKNVWQGFTFCLCLYVLVTATSPISCIGVTDLKRVKGKKWKPGRNSNLSPTYPKHFPYHNLTIVFSLLISHPQYHLGLYSLSSLLILKYIFKSDAWIGHNS